MTGNDLLSSRSKRVLGITTESIRSPRNPERSRRRELNRQLFEEGKLTISQRPDQFTHVHQTAVEEYLEAQADLLLFPEMWDQLQVA